MPIPAHNRASLAEQASTQDSVVRPDALPATEHCALSEVGSRKDQLLAQANREQIKLIFPLVAAPLGAHA